MIQSRLFNIKNNTFSIFLCLLFFAEFSYCQTKKNSFAFFYSPVFSKTNFDNLPIFKNDWFEQLYNTKKPDKGMYGYYYGLYYRREILEKFRIGIGVNYSRNGQQSVDFYKIKGISEQDLMNIPDYGGTSYRITYKSYEFPLFFEYIFQNTKKLNFFITLGASFNVYYRVEAENFLISKSTGQKDVGCCYDVYFHATGGKIKELKRHIDLGLTRTGFLFGGGMEYKPIPLFSLCWRPMVKLYSDIHDASEANTILTGRFFNIGCEMSLGINF